MAGHLVRPSRDSDADKGIKKHVVGHYAVSHTSPTVVDEELQESDKPFKTKIKDNPSAMSTTQQNQLDMHTIS